MAESANIEDLVDEAEGMNILRKSVRSVKVTFLSPLKTRGMESASKVGLQPIRV